MLQGRSSAGKLVRKENPWTTRSSRTTYQNKWIRVREDQVTRPDGSPGIYGVVEVAPSVGIIAVNQKDCVVLIGQWRYPLGRYLLEIPRGGSAGHPDILAAAERELAEEAGVVATTWNSLGAVEVNSGITSDVQHLFLAQDLSPASATHDADEQLDVIWLPLAEAIRMVMDGQISEVCSVAALLKVARMRGL